MRGYLRQSLEHLRMRSNVEFSLYSLASHGADRLFHDLPVKMPTGMG
jgi:hypothetical protein